MQGLAHVEPSLRPLFTMYNTVRSTDLQSARRTQSTAAAPLAPVTERSVIQASVVTVGETGWERRPCGSTCVRDTSGGSLWSGTRGPIVPSTDFADVLGLLLQEQLEFSAVLGIDFAAYSVEEAESPPPQPTKCTLSLKKA